MATPDIWVTLLPIIYSGIWGGEALYDPNQMLYTGPADQEKRCYLTWQRGDLSHADIDLFSRAGLSPGDRVVLKILPVDVEAKLATLEKDYAGDDASDVSRTQFGIRAAGDGFEFYVAQQYRKERAKK